MEHGRIRTRNNKEILDELNEEDISGSKRGSPKRKSIEEVEDLLNLSNRDWKSKVHNGRTDSPC